MASKWHFPKGTPFWDRMEKTENGCWIWMGGVNKDGYGLTCAEGKTCTAHRLAYKLAKGAIPEGMCVCHSCDNPPCCNPDHLWLGTNQENTHDRNIKGRMRIGASRGVANYNAKLTSEQVRIIRNRVANGEKHRIIASDFGIDDSTVSCVANRKRYREVE